MRESEFIRERNLKFLEVKIPRRLPAGSLARNDNISIFSLNIKGPADYRTFRDSCETYFIILKESFSINYKFCQ